MALESRILISDLDRILGIDAVTAYLNRDENRSYNHYSFEQTVLTAFNDGLRPYIAQAADFEATWTDLGRLLRMAVTGKLGEADGERLNKYCSHSDYGELNSAKNGKLGYIVPNNFFTSFAAEALRIWLQKNRSFQRRYWSR